MSEDTDERMERATRIREMREGQRRSAPADDGQDDDESSTGDDTPEPADDSASPSDETPAPDDATSTDGEAAVAADAGSTTAEAESGASGQDEAAAVAQRAAQTAAQVTGGGTDAAAATEATADGQTVAESGQPAADGEPAVPMQGPTGVELPDQESIEAAIGDENLDADAEAAPASASGRVVEAQTGATAEETIRVLEFTLGDEHYCLDIDHVEEIVKRDSITRVPNTPDYVEGVVDLRGQITTILDPKRLLDIDGEGSESLLVVFEPEAFEDQGAIGWVVDEVRQVVPVAESMITDAPVDADYVEGVIDRDDEDEFVIWTNPEVAIEIATGEREEDGGA